MALPYARSSAGEKHEARIRATLRSVGATMIGTATDDEHELIIVQFRLAGREVTLPVSIRAYAEAWLRENPHTYRHKSTAQQHRQKARDQAENAVWAILADWLKAQATMMATGLFDADTAFLAHIQLPNGQRVVEALSAPNIPIALPKPETD